MVVLCMMLARASRGSLRNWTFTLNLQLLEQIEFIHTYTQGEI